MSVLPLPLRNIILSYCFYPCQKYLSELKTILITLKRDFDINQCDSADIAMTSMAVINVAKPALFHIEINQYKDTLPYKEAIILILFNRENKRRKEMGLPINTSIYNHNIGSRISINY